MMILDDSFVVSSLGAASKPLEWSARAGSSVLIVLIGLFVLRKSEWVESCESQKERGARNDFVERRVEI